MEAGKKPIVIGLEPDDHKTLMELVRKKETSLTAYTLHSVLESMKADLQTSVPS